MKYAVVSSVVLLLFGVHLVQAQQTTPCRVLCTPEFKVEPTDRRFDFHGTPMPRITELLRGPMRDRPRARAGEQTKTGGIRRPCVRQAC